MKRSVLLSLLLGLSTGLPACQSATLLPSAPVNTVSISPQAPITPDRSDAVETQENTIAARRPIVLEDQAKPGSSFYIFRQQLRQAVRDRDAAQIRAIAAPDIKLSFGNPITLEDLDIDNPNSLFWQHLERVLAVGCTPYEFPSDASNSAETWACPHVFQASLGDPFSDVYIVGENVNVRARPQADSPVVGVLSNEVVQLDLEGLNRLSESQRARLQTFDGWQPIIMPQGQQGYVSSRYAYFPAGYRAIFQQTATGWTMTVFIAGD
jgi:hypothetical protein